MIHYQLKLNQIDLKLFRIQDYLEGLGPITGPEVPVNKPPLFINLIASLNSAIEKNEFRVM